MLEEKEWKQTEVGRKYQKISDVVSANTKRPVKQLLYDDKTYFINNIKEATDLFRREVMKGSYVKIVGDYDADGECSLSIFGLLVNAIGVHADLIVPRRFSDGYGLNERFVDEMKSGLLITVDNGIAAIDAIKKARNKGIAVIILDHHQPTTNKFGEVTLPDANVIVDPHVTGGDFKDYCGAGLAYRFAEAILGNDPKYKTIKKKMAGFAAIGTIADAVNLLDDNRKIVKEGLKYLSEGITTTGMKLLIESFNLSDRIVPSDIGYKIAPAINAYGRLDDKGSRKVLKTIVYDGPFNEFIKNNVQRLMDMNERRKFETEKGILRCNDIISQNKMMNDKFIIIYDESCPEGIAGIEAGRIAEKYDRPVIVFTKSRVENILKGSGRSPEWANMKTILDKNSDLIYKYGGHPTACGISIETKNLEALRDALQLYMPDKEVSDDAFLYDLEINEEDIQKALAELDKFAPYGNGNPEPIFMVNSFKLYPRNDGFIQLMGNSKQHIRMFGKKTNAVAFDLASKYMAYDEPKRISLIGTISMNCFKEYKSIQLEVLDFKPKTEYIQSKLAARLAARANR